MKAKIFLAVDNFQIKLENGDSFQFTANQGIDEMVENLANDYSEAIDEIAIIDEKKLRSSATSLLLKKYATVLPSIEADLIYNVLISRGQEVEPKIAIVEKKKVGRKPKTAVNGEEVKKFSTSTSMDDAEAEYKQFKHLVGHIISFVRFGNTIPEEGRVKNITIDKRVNKAYLIIASAEDNLRYYTRANNKTIKVLV